MITEIRTYFQSIRASVGCNYFDYGGDLELLESLKNLMEYPAMLLEYPEVGFSGDRDSLFGEAVFGVNILTQVAADEPEAARTAAMEAMFAIIMQVAANILNDFALVHPAHLKAIPITRFTHDNLYGWRLNVMLPDSTTICLP